MTLWASLPWATGTMRLEQPCYQSSLLLTITASGLEYRSNYVYTCRHHCCPANSPEHHRCPTCGSGHFLFPASGSECHCYLISSFSAALDVASALLHVVPPALATLTVVPSVQSPAIPASESLSLS
ncbi:hypothetical protein MHYP_G00299320 [Metynnis hypsauchen]